MEKKIRGKKVEPFLTLTTTSINGWCMASCPEFEVSACGSSPAAVVTDLHDMIIRSASLCLREESNKVGKKESRIIWSKQVVKNKNRIAEFFRTTAS